MHARQIFSNSQGCIYMSLMCSTCTHSICTSATKDVYIHPLAVLHATKIFSCQQPRMYIYVLHVFRQQPTMYAHPYKETFNRCLVAGCIFLWLLSYIYKVLEITEIMSHCITNSQGCIYPHKKASRDLTEN